MQHVTWNETKTGIQPSSRRDHSRRQVRTCRVESVTREVLRDMAGATADVANPRVRREAARKPSQKFTVERLATQFVEIFCRVVLCNLVISRADVGTPIGRPAL